MSGLALFAAVLHWAPPVLLTLYAGFMYATSLRMCALCGWRDGLSLTAIYATLIALAWGAYLWPEPTT